MALSSGVSITEIQAAPEPPGFGPNQLRKLAVLATVVAGLFLVIFGAGLIPGLINQMGELGQIVIFGGAAYLFALAPFAWILFGRVMGRKAIRVVVSSTEISAQLANQTSFIVNWSDPTFEGDITQSTLKPEGPDSFSWRVGRRQAYASVTRAGHELLEAAARQNNLDVQSITNGKPPRTWTTTRIRPKRPATPG